MPVPFLDLRAQYESIKGEINPAIQNVIESSAFALGPAVEHFEKQFAAYCGVKHCIGVSSGTSAITLLLKAHKIGPGDEVITAANSFLASAEGITHAGATPVLVDVLESTGNMDPALLEAAFTPKTKAILVVHLYGQPADMDPIIIMAKKRKLLVFEDAAQAHGARYKSRQAGLPADLSPEASAKGEAQWAKAGSLADGATFSFYAGKNLGAYGEAGAVLTNDASVAETIRMLREHGSKKKYEHEIIGFNERMDGIQGAVLSVKLRHLDAWNTLRRKHAGRYREKLKGVGDLHFFEELPECEGNYHLFVVRTAKRDALKTHLEKAGIGVGIHYPIPIHLQKAYASLGGKKGDCPVAEKLSKEILSLPMYAELTEKQVEEVCGAVQDFF